MADETLRVISGNAGGTEIKLEGEFLIGRSAEGDGKLGDDPEISRHHARVTRRADGQLAIEDLGSTNGTLVNGRKVEEATTLRPGDTIKVGTTTLQVLDASGNAPQATALGAVPKETDEGATALSTRPPAPPPPAAAPAAAAAAAAPPDAAAPAAAAPSSSAAPAPRTPSGPPPRPPLSPPSSKPSGGGGRRIAAGLLGLLLIAGAVAAVVLLTGGDDSGGEENEVLSTREIAAQNRGAVVRVDTRGPARDDDGNRIVTSGGGTGFVIDGKRGMLLTNAHVVAGQTAINVTVNGEESNAAVLGQAPCEDLAVLELRPRPPGLKTSELGTARGLRAGDQVTAMGYPGAFERELTERRLQATNGTVSSGVAAGSLGDALPEYPALIQHQAPISPGNSGGPLFNDRGQVVGVNSVGIAGGGSENQNGAISIDRAKAVQRDLMANKDSGYVGWNLVPVSGDEVDFLFVQGVDPDSPADRANLVFGDAIVEVDDTPVSTIADVCDIISSKSSGDRLKVSGVSIPTSSTFTVRARLR